MMATKYGRILPTLKQSLCIRVPKKNFHTSPVCEKVVAGRYFPTKKQNFPLTYEMSNKPDMIGVRKAWNSWNTSNLLDGLRRPETAVEDLMIRKMVSGTWHRLFASEIIIKRRHNVIFIGGFVVRSIHPRKMYFLIGYTEELLSCLFKCPVKLELNTVEDRKQLVFRYI